MLSNGWDFNGSAVNEATLRPLCEKVEVHFQLGDCRVYRYFAVHDDENLQERNGQHFRGFHCPIAARDTLPRYLLDCFFHPLNLCTAGSFANFADMVAFDHLIYITKSTCSDRTGCVTTYAHELQHVTQHERWPRILRVNQALYQNLKRFEPNATASDIPHEREANIVSKRVAEAVCGVEAVRSFADRQVRFWDEQGNNEQRERWIFFRNVPSSSTFDLLKATQSLVDKYRDVINFDVDVSQSQWWLGGT